MYGNALLMDVVVAERLAEARAAAAQERLLQALRPRLRAIIGARLVEIGERLLGSARATPALPVTARQTRVRSGR